MRQITWSVFTLALLLLGCVSEPKRNSAEPEWYSRMHQISSTYTSVAALTADPISFSHPKNQATLSTGLKDLADLGQATAADPQAPDADPLIGYAAKNFARFSKDAYTAYKSHDFAWTKFAVRRMGDQCIACHTRADRGAKDYPLAWKPQLFNLNRPQRIDFWLSNRQYSLALSESLHLAGDGSEALADPMEWLTTLEKVMTMIVRVERSTRAAEMVTQAAVKNPLVPAYIKTDLQQWNRDIQKWKAQGKVATENERYKLAQNLVKQQIPAPPHSHANFVSNLRISSLLHELLENSKFKYYPEVLEASGSNSENLGEFGLGQFYYESCIREVPHSILAERCFYKLSGSTRNTAPYADDIATKLEALKDLSSTKWEGRPRLEKESPLTP